MNQQRGRAGRSFASCQQLGEVLEDLQQVAQLELAQAVDIYDSSRDAPFHVFATRTILSDLKQHVRDRA